jgi:hypothetical protein
MSDAAGGLSAGEGLDDCERTPFGGERSQHDALSVWSSSARMKLPSRRRTSCGTGASFAWISPISAPRMVSFVSICA